jgi:hypothetical protein
MLFLWSVVTSKNETTSPGSTRHIHVIWEKGQRQSCARVHGLAVGESGMKSERDVSVEYG